MKSTQHLITLVLGVACLALSIATVFIGKTDIQVQTDLQKRQNEIQAVLQQRQAEVNRGITSDRLGGAILQDMAIASQKNEKLKEVLAKNGYTVTTSTNSK